MDYVASARTENANLRKIQQKLLQWEIKDQALAPLTNLQQDAIENLSQQSNFTQQDTAAATVSDTLPESMVPAVNSKTYMDLKSQTEGIESPLSFLYWYNTLDSEMYDRMDDIYTEYYEQLQTRSEDCDNLLHQIDGALQALGTLESEYNFVSNKTSSLNTASEQLIQEQKKLNEIGNEIKRRLHFFTQSEQLMQRLHSPTLSVSSEIFLETLNKIDECLEYLQSNPKYKDAASYTIKYRQCLSKAVLVMKNYVMQIFLTATDQVIESKKTSNDDKSSDTAFAIYYGKFQATAPKAKRITTLIEERLDRSQEYEQLLAELHQTYLSQRANILCSEVDVAIRDLTASNKGDHCAMVRSACAFMVHVCKDEHRLFYQFFTNASSQLNAYLEGLCTILYDTLRPFIIHINHLETLAEVCSILRVEMLDEHVQHNPEPLEAFGKIAHQLLQDVQERLVFRANRYLHSDILNYKPSAGDLAYPEKLELMERIAISLQEPIFRRSESRASIVSLGSVTSQEVEHISNVAEQQMRARTGNSPADLHGMWYPTVRRTLGCLSRLYRCVDRPIFQGLSQEALTYCIQSVSSAAQQISSKQTSIDGELFEIKHLLILREQIAPFRVDFTVTETTLDFSKVKTAAFKMLQNRKQVFAIGSNNAILEFLLEGAPQVKEHQHDSRKDVDRQLKTVCEQFIRDATRHLIGPVTSFLEKAQSLLKQSAQQANVSNQAQSGAINYALRQTLWASPQQISGVIQEAQRLIKGRLSGVQRSMQLYLSNKDTEFILFRPIRNNIIGAFVKLEQVLTTNGYSTDDLIIASCPTADQISVLLSASVLAEGGAGGNTIPIVLGAGNRKISTSSMDNSIQLRKTSVEKKVSFDESPLILDRQASVQETAEEELTPNLNASKSSEP